MKTGEGWSIGLGGGELFELKRIYTFHAAHKLPWHKGKCNSIHGHTYKVVVHVSGELDENGVVVDFHTIDSVVEPVIRSLDHKFLNDFLPNPTAELIAKHIYDEISNQLPVSKIEVWETERSCASYIPKT